MRGASSRVWLGKVGKTKVVDATSRGGFETGIPSADKVDASQIADDTHHALRLRQLDVQRALGGLGV